MDITIKTEDNKVIGFIDGSRFVQFSVEYNGEILTDTSAVLPVRNPAPVVWLYKECHDEARRLAEKIRNQQDASSEYADCDPEEASLFVINPHGRSFEVEPMLLGNGLVLKSVLRSLGCQLFMTRAAWLSAMTQGSDLEAEQEQTLIDLMASRYYVGKDERGAVCVYPSGISYSIEESIERYIAELNE